MRWLAPPSDVRRVAGEDRPAERRHGIRERILGSGARGGIGTDEDGHESRGASDERGTMVSE